MAPVEQDNMAKKKKGLAAFKAKSKAIKEVVNAKTNPPPLTDLAEFIAPGFVGYAGTRFTSRAVHSVVIKRWPKLAKHASVLSTFGAAGLAYILVHRVKKIEKYHTPVVVGAGIAAIQTLVQAYLPKYGWLVSDHNLNQLPPPQPIAPQPSSSSPEPAADFKTLWPAKPIAMKKEEEPAGEELIDELDELDLGSLGSSPDDEGDFSDDDIDELLN
jgi:hypothetical protein